MLCAARSDQACARQTIAQHPYARLYEAVGRKPGEAGEVSYLAARAFIAVLDGKPDPVAQAALGSADAGLGREAELDRAAGLAFALPSGPARQAAILGIAARLKASAERPSGVFGGWTRPSALDQILLAVALARPGAPNVDPDTSFALFQLAGRAGPSFDADALTALGQARSTLERRSIHQGAAAQGAPGPVRARGHPGRGGPRALDGACRRPR